MNIVNKCKGTVKFSCPDLKSAMYIPNEIAGDSEQLVVKVSVDEGEYKFTLTKAASKGGDYAYTGPDPWKSVYLPQEYRCNQQVYLTVI